MYLRARVHKGDGRRGRSASVSQRSDSHTRAGGADVRLLHALGLDVPAGEVVLEDADEAFFGVVAVLRAG